MINTELRHSLCGFSNIFSELREYFVADLFKLKVFETMTNDDVLMEISEREQKYFLADIIATLSRHIADFEKMESDFDDFRASLREPLL